MKKPRLPKTDSIKKLADFWGRHDLTDFDDQPEEVTEPLFVRGTAISVPLDPREAEAVGQIAQAEGLSREELLHGWVQQQLARDNDARQAKR
jgi:hypothetical protein